MAVAVSTAVFVSLVVSVLVIPSFAARLLKSSKRAKKAPEIQEEDLGRVGRAVRSSYRRHRLTLDRWGIALTVAGELQGSSRDSWRVHHDACAARMFDDALRAGTVGRTEVHTLFSDLLPPPLPGARRERRAGLVPDALLARRATGEDEGWGVCDHLHDVKMVHY